MIERYTRPEMGPLWKDEHKFAKLLEVEIAVAQVQAQLGIIPRKAARQIAERARFSVKRIQEIEKVTKHDVIAFVSNCAEEVGEAGKYIHFGMTSSDVLDTAFSLQLREAGDVLLSNLLELKEILFKLAHRESKTLCAGRTHGMFAEPTTFGFKMAGFYSEFQRHEARLLRALEQMRICKLSGAVGTYSGQSPEVEKKVAAKLKLRIEPFATQVVPRDRHAEVLFALAMIGGGLERLAVELRHLQRSEVAEVCEGFSQGQKGSSAMPHKKNPISAENITGSARLLRAYLQAGLENLALWHERDISHSSVERVAFPDAFILCDYALDRMKKLLRGLDVRAQQMRANLEKSQGQLFSSHVLLYLVKKGYSREEAYRHVQRIAHSLGEGDHLQDLILKDSVLKDVVRKKELQEIFSGQVHRRAIMKVLKDRLKRHGREL